MVPGPLLGSRTTRLGVLAAAAVERQQRPIRRTWGYILRAFETTASPQVRESGEGRPRARTSRRDRSDAASFARATDSPRRESVAQGGHSTSTRYGPRVGRGSYYRLARRCWRR